MLGLFGGTGLRKTGWPELWLSVLTGHGSIQGKLRQDQSALTRLMRPAK